MKKWLILLAVLAGVNGVASSLKAAELNAWLTDYQQALKLAAAQQKSVVLDFTGSDWCGWCKKLNKEILSTPEFLSYAQEKLILVEVDFPQEKPQTDALKKQNEELARQFNVEGFPTLVILDAKGKEQGRLGYQPDGPQPFLVALRKVTKSQDAVRGKLE